MRLLIEPYQAHASEKDMQELLVDTNLLTLLYDAVP